MPWFLDTRPSAACAKGGKGAYSDSIQTIPGQPEQAVGLSEGLVAASAFRSNYVPLSTQADFIAGLRVSILLFISYHHDPMKDAHCTFCQATCRRLVILSAAS